MPRILSDATSAVGGVVWLVVACGDCRAVRDGLLDMYFVCYIFRVGKKIVVSVSYAVKGGCFLVFEYFFVYFFRAFVIEFSVFGDGFFDT